MRKVLRVSLFAFISLGAVAAINAATFTVNTTNDTADATPGDGICADAATQCSLRAAISEANALAGPDIITVGAVAYTQSLVAANEDLNAGGDWDVTSEITINGVSEASTILQAAATSGTATERVINVRAGANLTLSQMTIRNGRFNGTMSAATRGAGIENVGILTLNNVTVRDNQVTSSSGNSIGAGIHNAGTALTLTNSTVTANANLRQAGGSAFGGGISSITAATIIFTNSSVSGNSAVTTATVAAFGFGAGLYLENVFNVTATNSHFDNNTGTGVLTGGGSNGCGVRALSATGAAVFNATNTTFNGNIGTGGTSNGGTGLQLFTVTTLAATLNVTLDRVTVNGNSGNSTGAGIGSQTNGGNMTVNILNSTVSNNTGAINGGGILATNAGSTLAGVTNYNITNSTISGNTVTGVGGGLAMEQPGTGTLSVNLNFATVANNRANNDNTGADTGGGIVRASGTLNFKNSLIADNTIGTGGTAPDLGGAAVSGDYNHVEDTTGATITGTTTNNTTGDPNLGTLANNGGPTLTHLPNVGSPVLNTIPNGTNDCGTTIVADQRQLVRPSGGSCDKGSTERAAGLAPGPWDLSGTVRTANGAGIRNVAVTVSGGGLPQPITTYTGSFGTYIFTGLPGASYTVSVVGKKYTFTVNSQVVSLGANVTNADFTADAGFGVKPSMEIVQQR